MPEWEIVGEIHSIECIARGRAIRERLRLIRIYGGKNWRKMKGFCDIRRSGKIVPAEVHWYEAHGVGRVEFKVKNLL